ARLLGAREGRRRGHGEVVRVGALQVEREPGLRVDEAGPDTERYALEVVGLAAAHRAQERLVGGRVDLPEGGGRKPLREAADVARQRRFVAVVAVLDERARLRRRGGGHANAIGRSAPV